MGGLGSGRTATGCEVLLRLTSLRYQEVRNDRTAGCTNMPTYNPIYHKTPAPLLIKICLGQEVFYRYGSAIFTGLTFQSLLGGLAANRPVEVLARTGGFSVKVARHRLFETAQHILECTKSLQSIQPGGAGFASSIRVRLLHAAVRQRIMKLEQSRPGYYNVEENGIPINDLQCIGTIGTFSAVIIWRSLPRQGLFLRKQEIEDYMALWRLIAHYTGTPTWPFESPAKAKVTMESLLITEIRPSETSRVLAGNLIKSLAAKPPTYASTSFLEVNARWLNGNELCDALGLGRPTVYYWALMAGQCLFFMALCYFYRSFTSLDRRKITVRRCSRRFSILLFAESLIGPPQDLLATYYRGEVRLRQRDRLRLQIRARFPHYNGGRRRRNPIRDQETQH